MKLDIKVQRKEGGTIMGLMWPWLSSHIPWPLKPSPANMIKASTCSACLMF